MDAVVAFNTTSFSILPYIPFAHIFIAIHSYSIFGMKNLFFGILFLGIAQRLACYSEQEKLSVCRAHCMRWDELYVLDASCYAFFVLGFGIHMPFNTLPCNVRSREASGSENIAQSTNSVYAN